MQQKTTMCQRMVSGIGRLQAVGRRGGGAGVLAVLLLLPLKAAGQAPLETLAPLESDAEVAALGPVAPGDLDTSFGGDGTVLTDFGGQDETTSLAIQPDGKLVVAGYAIASSGGSVDFALVRYLPNGALDPTFGGDGRVLTDFSGVGSYDVASAIAIQPDGKLVVAGFSNASGSPDFALARYRPNGTLDPAFGGDGKVLTDFGSGSSDVASALALQPHDGRLVVAATQFGTSASRDFALARYHAITCSGAVVTQVGTAGNDTIIGTPGNDVIFGFAGNDTISGLGGDDILCGGTGNDTLRGGSGNDLLSGGPGTDRCNGGSPGSGDTASGCERVTGVP
jgi:uncharacterized delta-60 repeat protein